MKQYWRHNDKSSPCRSQVAAFLFGKTTASSDRVEGRWQHSCLERQQQFLTWLKAGGSIPDVTKAWILEGAPLTTSKGSPGAASSATTAPDLMRLASNSNLLRMWRVVRAEAAPVCIARGSTTVLRSWTTPQALGTENAHV